jgi:ABC-type lipoprotein export system ATPase subunit
VIFADEPAGALDLATSREVLGLLRDALAETGTAPAGRLQPARRRLWHP